MEDLRLSEIMSMQRELQEKHKGEWTPLTPEYGRSCLLWMMEEFGEVVAVLKKREENAIMNDETVRSAFIEELADVLMFYNDALICYGITSEELSKAFIKKHNKNMKRNFIKEYSNYLLEK